jgi:arylformamidase
LKRIFLSHFLGRDTPFYGGEGIFQIESLRSMNSGDSCNACRWSFPNHAGTHIDLPRHFIPEGRILDDYPPDFWIFHHVSVTEIVDIYPGAIIGSCMLDHYDIPSSTELLLLKTGFGKFRGTPTYSMENPVFHPELAEFLRIKFSSLRAIGFDTISISSWTDRMIGRIAHRAFLGGNNPILLIEDMDLSQINKSTVVSSAIVAPLLVCGTDASPCTIIAEVADI